MKLEKLYEYYIVLFYLENYHDISVLNEKDYDLDYIYDYVNKLYYDTFNVKLDIGKKENRKKLYEFLNHIFKFYLLKDNIDEFYTILNKDSERFILNNFSKIVEIVEKSYKETELFKDYNIAKLPNLSYEDLDDYFKEFLIFIDNSYDYLEIYSYIKSHHKIIYLDLLSDNDKNKFKSRLNIVDTKYNDFFLRNERMGGYIVLDRNETIEDFSKLAHEFIHYVTFKKNNNFNNVILEEFPSIFYETLANIFLIDKGFDKEKVGQIIFDRNKYINNLSYNALNINLFLNIYLKNDFNINEELIKKEISLNDFLISKLCDYSNYHFTLNPNRIVNSYPYIIGNYLGNRYINKYLKKDNILNKVKYITDNLPNIDAKELINDDNVKIKKLK